MSKILSALLAGAFAVATVTPAFAAEEKKEAMKVDCKDPKNKDHKDCVKAKKK